MAVKINQQHSYISIFTAGPHCLQCNRCIATAVSVRPSSVTRWYCVETNEATIMRFSLSGSKIILVSFSEIHIYFHIEITVSQACRVYCHCAYAVLHTPRITKIINVNTSTIARPGHFQ